MENLGKTCLFIILLMITTLLGGFVFMKLWEWFIATTFHISPLSLAQSVGAMMIIRFVMPNKTTDGKNDMEDLAKAVIGSIVMCLLTLGLAWIITFFY